MSKLKSIKDNAAMKSVRPQALFTLWFVTGEKQYSDAIKKDYPSSPEYAVVSGRARMLGTPFWFFVPRAAEEKEALSAQIQTREEHKSAITKPAASKPVDSKTSAPKYTVEEKKESVKSEAKSEATKTQAKTSTQATAKESAAKAPAKESSSKEAPAKKIRQQLGLFRNQKNADELVKSAKAKGFNAYSYSEVRPSGTTYYIVVVDENAEKSMGKQLRSAGFDCYPVE